MKGNPDADLAARHFDERELPGLVRDGMPREGIAHLREKYIRDAQENPEAMRQLREIYGAATDDYTFSGHYRPCLECRAPIVYPLPLDGWMDLIAEFQGIGVFVYCMPHRPDCYSPPQQPEHGTVTRVQNRYVTSMQVGLP